MKGWWRNIVMDYLTFSKRERRGIAIIFLVCLLAWLFSRYYPIDRPQFDKSAFQKELTQLTITIDSSRQNYRNRKEDLADYNRPTRYNVNRYSSVKVELFAFDPNTLTVAGWKKLGLRDKTVETIQHFLAKGYRFKKPEDIKKIYGLRPQEAERLISYVEIAAKETVEKPSFEKPHSTPLLKPNPEVRKTKMIDVNDADTSDLISLPGIGSKLALRIINFREKLGGFYSANQVAETYGIPDSTFQKIKTRLQCNSSDVRKINVNKTDANELKSHPYIKWNIANAIVNYRKQHGDFKSLEELQKIEIVSDEVFEKIAPYLIF